MPPRPHRMRLRAFQGPGFHRGIKEKATSDAPRAARPPPMSDQSPANEGSTIRDSNATDREVIVARPAQRRVAPGSSLRSDHDHRNA